MRTLYERVATLEKLRTTVLQEFNSSLQHTQVSSHGCLVKHPFTGFLSLLHPEDTAHPTPAKHQSIS